MVKMSRRPSAEQATSRGKAARCFGETHARQFFELQAGVESMLAAETTTQPVRRCGSLTVRIQCRGSRVTVLYQGKTTLSVRLSGEHEIPAVTPEVIADLVAQVNNGRSTPLAKLAGTLYDEGVLQTFRPGEKLT